MLNALNENRHDLYIRAYYKTLQLYIDNPEQPLEPLIQKMIVYGIKAVTSKPEPEFVTREDAEDDFNFADVIIGLMSFLTPGKLMNLFPIAKDFKGNRWGMKDYFYTRDYLKGIDMDKPIGKGDGVLNFLWEYHNWELTDFNVEVMGYMSRLRKLDGKPSLAQDFANIMGWKTYKMYTDDKGKQYLLDPETGKTTKVKPSKKRHLKIAK